MKVQIERSYDVNPQLFDLLSSVQRKSTDLDEAKSILEKYIKAEHPLYWLYRGGHHLAICSHNHTKRIAIITE